MTKPYKSKNAGVPYFLTFTVVEWVNIFTKPIYFQLLWDSLQYCRREKGLRLHAFVFMTNHMHLIASAGRDDIPLWSIIRDFKKFTAQKIIQYIKNKENRDWILPVLHIAGRQSGVNVQYQFWIHDDGAVELHSDHFLRQKMNYLHENPVRAGIVDDAAQYCWSSARLYERDNTELIDLLE